MRCLQSSRKIFKRRCTRFARSKRRHVCCSDGAMAACFQEVDVGRDVESEALDAIQGAIDKCNGNYEVAARSVKEQMDRKFGATWHCIIGKPFFLCVRSSIFTKFVCFCRRGFWV